MALKPFRPVKVSLGGVRPGSSAAADIKRLTDSFASWTAHMTNQSGEVLREALKPTFQKSQEWCPILTGALRQSGYLEVRRVGLLGGWQAEIGYGRGNLPHYTVMVHEMPTFHRPPTRWKWLQEAIQQDGAEIQARIRNGYKTVSGT